MCTGIWLQAWCQAVLLVINGFESCDSNHMIGGTRRVVTNTRTHGLCAPPVLFILALPWWDALSLCLRVSLRWVGYPHVLCPMPMLNLEFPSANSPMRSILRFDHPLGDPTFTFCQQTLRLVGRCKPPSLASPLVNLSSSSSSCYRPLDASSLGWF